MEVHHFYFSFIIIITFLDSVNENKQQHDTGIMYLSSTNLLPRNQYWPL